MMRLLRWMLWRWLGAYAVGDAMLDSLETSIREQAQEMGL